MTDPLSVTAGIAGLISLGIQVTGSLINFFTSYKAQDTDIARTTTKLESLLDTFRFLEAALQRRIFQPDEQNLLQNIESSVQNCDELIQELNEECEKFNRASTTGIKGTIRVVGRRAAYPFRQSTLQKLDEAISEIRHNISLALDVLQLGDHQNTQDEIIQIRSLLEVVRASQVSSTIRDWLRAPDPAVDHNAACAKCYPGTGTWFVKGSVFTTWLSQDNSFLWLNGFAGCGKSVLCSTAIQHSFRRKKDDRGVGIAFFYFTFNDSSKQDESAMLRALLLQLSGQLSDSQTDLARLHDSSRTVVPSPVVLVAYLQRLIQKFDQVYILLDALDEIPRYGQRDRVLDTVQTMRKWLIPGLHLLITSRDEPDIRGSLSPAGHDEVVMKNAGINQDITNFISRQINTDPKLQKWRAHHDRIQQALAGRAHGVFRWVECQFESLRRCPRSESHLDYCLQSLPRGLDETYERILCNIDEGSIEEAQRILTLLCFSSRPLTVSELIDGIAVDLNTPAHFDPRRRLQDADDLLEICPGLINFDAKVDDKIPHINNKIKRNTPFARIAHFSVQEYLESNRIKQQRAALFGLQNASAQAEIAQICLAYLQEPDLSTGKLNQIKLDEFPLAHFAALFWHYHYKHAESATSLLDDLALRMFRDRQGSYSTWVKLHDVDKPWDQYVNFERDSNSIANPLYYASLLGFDKIVRELLNTCQDDTAENQSLINTQGGLYGNALQAASSDGHEKVVQMLIDAGANVNAQGGYHGNALQAASTNDHNKVVQMLIDAGADVNAQGGFYGNALQAASIRGHENVVRILIDEGANTNARRRIYGNALYAASRGGHENLVRILIDAGANVNARGGFYGSALKAALVSGHEEMAQILIDAGAVDQEKSTEDRTQELLQNPRRT